jgi:dTDP-4-amino-4,6-dideoxygalactose transaminase
MNAAGNSSLAVHEETTPLQFLDLVQQFEQIRAEVMRAVAQVFETQRFVLGPEVEQLETEIANYLGCRFAIACASGTDALILALLTVGIGPGDEVITTPFTFVATASAIARLGARPVFVDIDPDTYNLDPPKLAAALSSKTRAIIPVHLFGLAADMQPIMDIATKHGIPVIEDAAQAIGASYHGKNLGSIGAMGCFSFFPSKNLGGAGDGGLVTTQEPDHADRLRLLRVHGSPRRYEYQVLGMNSRLDALQAAILRVKLKYLNEWTEQRRRNAERYRDFLSHLHGSGHVVLPREPYRTRHVYNQFTIRCKKRDALRAHLRQKGIPTEIYYPHPLHLQHAFRYLGYKEGSIPQAESMAREVVSLPVYPELSEGQQRLIAGAVASFYGDSIPSTTISEHNDK